MMEPEFELMSVQAAATNTIDWVAYITLLFLTFLGTREFKMKMTTSLGALQGSLPGYVLSWQSGVGGALSCLSDKDINAVHASSTIRI